LYRKKFAGEPYDEAAIDTRLKTAVAEIARRQAATGIDVIDDGEFSKLSFWAYARSRLEGVVARPLKRAPGAREETFFRRAGQTASSTSDRTRFAEFYRDAEGPDGVTVPPSIIQFYMPLGTAHELPTNHVVEGPIKYKAEEVRRDIANLTQAVDGVEYADAFLPAVAPGMLATRYENEYYKSDEEYYFALADALHEEYTAITDAGFVLQIDDVSLPGRRRLLPGGDGLAKFTKWANLAIDALNQALRGIPPDRVRYHMCWSSMNAPHTDDPPLIDLVDSLLRINAGAYQIEAANARHEHEYHLWEEIHLPEGKILMPGVICHATNVIEHPDYVAERILRYANLVGRTNVIAATDCGLRGRVHPQIAWAKLEALVEGARIATAKLWR
jgi:5-methyltetrahydropteroyltriglutamate--homocysteine methyltransferase